jgi:hypothetical protein
MSWIRTVFHRWFKVAAAKASEAQPPEPAEEPAVKTLEELEAELRARGWRLEGPTRRPSGWRLAIRRPGASMSITTSTIQEALESLLRGAKERDAKERGDEPPEQP